MNKFLFIFLSFILFFYAQCVYSQELLDDDFVNETLKNADIKKAYVNTNYNYEDLECIPIKLKVAKEISTKKDLQDGDIAKFYIRQDVKYNKHIILRKNTPVTAKVRTYVTRGMNGIPGELVLDEFTIPNIDSNKIKGPYIKKGLDLSILVFPLKWALTPIPFVGSVTNLIIGGHAKLKHIDTVLIYYYPNWNE